MSSLLIFSTVGGAIPAVFMSTACIWMVKGAVGYWETTTDLMSRTDLRRTGTKT